VTYFSHTREAYYNIFGLNHWESRKQDLPMLPV